MKKRRSIREILKDAPIKLFHKVVVKLKLDLAFKGDKPVDPDVSLNFWEKSWEWTKGAFSFVNKTVDAVNGFHASIKWIVVALVLVLIIVLAI